MNIDASIVKYLYIITAIIPALLAMRLAKKQKRSILTSGIVTFFLGLTFIGGWIYLAIMNLLAPKSE